MNAEILYEGKAKKIFKSAKAGEVVMEFKDSLTAFNAQKRGSFTAKGQINREIASLIFKFLKKNKIESHWIKDIDDNKMLVKTLKIIPLEVVVRNVLAGSTAKKFGLEEGQKLPKPLVEFYYKKDELNDPFVSEDQVIILKFATAKDMAQMKKQALKINSALLKLFKKINIDLIDFKVEFGKDKSGKILLGDEITPDSCRLWDKKTKEKLDKDQFRRDLGNVEGAYHEVLQRLKGVKL